MYQSLFMFNIALRHIIELPMFLISNVAEDRIL